MNSARSLRIGITIGLRDVAESLWVNGIKQNALYLAKVFQNSPLRHQVLIVNTTDVEITPRLPWDIELFPVYPFERVKDLLDVVIELGGQIDAAQTAYVKSRGTRIVSYCCGPEYVQMIEAMLFKRRLADLIFINQRYDEVWAIPQVVQSSSSFFSVLRRKPVREVPFVWDPMFLNERGRDLRFQGEYRPTMRPKRLSIMEPNIDVLKFCLYPLLIAEQAYRLCGRKIDFVHVTNADMLARECPEFIGVARYLDLVKDGRVSFVGRYDTPQFLSEHTDIVISHQWGLPLNYFYFDVCWMGYALVHNAQLCSDIGYYYAGSDVDEASQVVSKVIEHHDDDWDNYRRWQRRSIGRFISTNPDVVATYDRLLSGLFECSTGER